MRAYRDFFNHINQPMRYMAAQLRVQRPPANIMFALAQAEQIWRERFANAGRNDPCPCGSGLKYKKCCARQPNPIKLTQLYAMLEA